ncbi:hypothetical protein QJQ45_001949 [Haematococcus lacustris]|nr:hypothetical protein QJQ45_001949 [Haematococcus lacustris]
MSNALPTIHTLAQQLSPGLERDPRESNPNALARAKPGVSGNLPEAGLPGLLRRIVAALRGLGCPTDLTPELPLPVGPACSHIPVWGNPLLAMEDAQQPPAPFPQQAGAQALQWVAEWATTGFQELAAIPSLTNLSSLLHLCRVTQPAGRGGRVGSREWQRAVWGEEQVARSIAVAVRDNPARCATGLFAMWARLPTGWQQEVARQAPLPAPADPQALQRVAVAMVMDRLGWLPKGPPTGRAPAPSPIPILEGATVKCLTRVLMEPVTMLRAEANARFVKDALAGMSMEKICWSILDWSSSTVIRPQIASLLRQLVAAGTRDLHAHVAPTVDDAIRAAITNHKALVAAAGSDFDVLLGNDWLNEHEAVMSYQDKTLSLACDKSEPVVLPCPSAGVSQSGQSAVSNPASFLVNALRAKPPLASAKVAARWLRKGGTGVLALITVDNSSTPDPAPAEPDLPPGVSQALNALLDEYADVFAPITSLPPERPVGHAIPLVPDARPSVVPQYRMSQDEHAELKKQVQDLLAKGMIEPSSSPFAAPILFVKKKSGELRMCLDYRQLNKITIRDQYPLPRIDDLFDKLSGCTVFSSLDLQAGYNQIRITPEDVPKTAFRTPDGHYQFKVLSFGLCNAPATFQRVMNDAFAPVLNQCALVYLDDILVMSKSVDEHLKHLRKVFDLLRLNKLFAKQSKCEFMRTTLKFLGHVIFAGAIAVDPEKIKSISSWPVPQSLQQLQSFLGAANFVRKFVHNFSVLAAPLTDLCGQAGDSFLWHNWPADELKAFASLKAAVAQVPMLRLPDHTQPFQVYCDASLQGVGAVLMQDGYPLAYLSKKLSSAERNYTTGEQELLALITACKEWRCYLEGVPFTLFTDHKPLTALPTQKVLSRRQARWMEFLSRFTFDLQYLPGDANPADPLSRIPAGPQDCAMVCVVTTRRQAKQSLERGEVRVAQALPQVPPVGTPSNAPTAVDALAPRPTVSDNPVAAHHSRLPELEAPSAADTSVHYPAAPAHPLELADHLVHGYRLDPAFTAEADLSGMYMDDHGLWRRTGKGTVMVPNDLELREYILHEMHDAAYAGHVGITKTLERLSRVFYWDTMRADVRHYVTTCDACQRDKSSTLKPGGLLNPLSIPDYRWESVSMDLITKLPSASHGFDAICVFVDRLSKMVHFVPCKESMNAKGFARLFVDNVFKLHGLPKDMVSDRGPHFHNTFWHHVQKLLGMRGSLSSSYHPQSDGQTERYNRVLEEMLRHYISPTQADWPDYLSLAEFAVNNSWQESIKSTPFLVNTGQSPITPMLHSLPDKGRCPEGLSYATWWQEAVAKAKLCMQAAQQRQAAYANQDRRDVHYKVGQMVLLSIKNMRLKPGKARKLLPRFVGPFKVLDLVGQVAVNLQLPASMSRLHPVFHVSLIKPYTGTDVGFMPPPVEWLDEEPVYYVERLLDHRHVHAGKAKEYLVQWEGYDADHNTWEPRSNLVGCDKILAEYNAAHNLKSTKQAQKLWPDRILALAYGAAGFSGSGSIGCRGVPVSQMQKEAVKQFRPERVVLVDEFRTSRVSSADNTPSETLLDTPPESFRWLRPVKSMAKRSQVRGLMCSTSINNITRFYDRDVSAALNIRRCAVGPGPRPTELCYWINRPAMPKPGQPGQEWVEIPDKPLPRGTDQLRGRVVLVDEHRTSRVSSAVNGKQPCEVELNTLSATRPAGWKPPAGQVEERLVRPAWSQERGQPVRGLMWCPVVAPRKPPQAPRSSQAATQPAASEPGPSTPPPAKRSKPASEPTKGKGKGKAAKAKAKPAPQPGRWLDRDCNAALNMQRIGESKWRPLELCYWPDQGALPAKGKEYPGLGYKRVRDKPPKAQEQQQQPAEAQ